MSQHTILARATQCGTVLDTCEAATRVLPNRGYLAQLIEARLGRAFGSQRVRACQTELAELWASVGLVGSTEPSPEAGPLMATVFLSCFAGEVVACTGSTYAAARVNLDALTALFETLGRPYWWADPSTLRCPGNGVVSLCSAVEAQRIRANVVLVNEVSPF